ncbi:uncharacterized, partial [Tachysurus ichikawai]
DELDAKNAEENMRLGQKATSKQDFTT